MNSRQHVSPFGYTRPPSGLRRVAGGLAGALSVAGLGAVVVVPWWIGIASLIGWLS
jgi:hypothetical protein